MGRFTVRCYDDTGVPINPEDDEPLPTVEAETAIEAAQTVRGVVLSAIQRPAMYTRAEVWPYGKPDEKISLFESA
jgi:hypothetical protein